MVSLQSIVLLNPPSNSRVPTDLKVEGRVMDLLINYQSDFALTTCDECGGLVIYNGKEFFCSQCGVVHGVPLSYKYRYGSDKGKREDGNRHHRSNAYLADHGLGSAPIKPAPGNERVLALCRAQKLALPDKQRKLKELQLRLRTIASQFNLPEYVILSAMKILNKAVDNKVTTIGAEPTICACIYYACRIESHPIKMDSFKKFCSLKQLNKAYKRLVSIMGVKPKPITPESYLKIACTKLKIPPKISSRALEIVREVQKVVSGRKPQCLAAGALYVAIRESNQDISYSKVADAFDITYSAVQDNAKIICDTLGIRLSIEISLVP